MTLVLELTPVVEQDLQASAARDGVAPAELAQRLLVSALRERKSFEVMQAQAAEGFAASGVSEDDLDGLLVRVVKEVRAGMSAQEAKR